MKTDTENNKADANKCVCLIYWEGECKMITRNYLGKLEPRIGKYEIMKNETWYTTKASIANEVMLWLAIEPFDSMVKAYAWLKKHVNELL